MAGSSVQKRLIAEIVLQAGTPSENIPHPRPHNQPEWTWNAVLRIRLASVPRSSAPRRLRV